MLCQAHRRNRPADRPDQRRWCLAAQARRRHAPIQSDQDAAARGSGGAGPGLPLRGRPPRARGPSGSRRECAAWRSGAPGPHSAGTPGHQWQTPGASGPPSSRRPDCSSLLCPPDLGPAAPWRPWAPAPRDRTRLGARVTRREEPVGRGRGAGWFQAAASWPPNAPRTPAARSSRVPSYHAVFSSSATRPSLRSRRRSCAKGGRKTYRHRRSTPARSLPTHTRWHADRSPGLDPLSWTG